MVDQNVYITPITPGGNTYYFPACHVYLHLDKHLNELPIPKGMIALDMLFSARTMRVVGLWRDDYGGNHYDGLPAFHRMVRFVTENELTDQIYQFHWSSGTFEEPDLYVKLISIDGDRAPGWKGDMPYNFVFRRITESV